MDNPLHGNRTCSKGSRRFDCHQQSATSQIAPAPAKRSRPVVRLKRASAETVAHRDGLAGPRPVRPLCNCATSGWKADDLVQPRSIVRVALVKERSKFADACAERTSAFGTIEIGVKH